MVTYIKSHVEFGSWCWFWMVMIWCIHCPEEKLLTHESISENNSLAQSRCLRETNKQVISP